VSDIYWLAGLYEGEGCFSQSGYSLEACIWMVDEDIMRRAHALIPVAKWGFRELPSRKTQYGLRLYGKNAVSLMMTLYPILGVRRQARIREHIEWWKARPGSGNYTRLN